MTPVYPAKACLLSTLRPSASIRFIYCIEPFAALVALVLLAPMMMTIMIVVAALSRRSPLVSHLRVGWRGTPLPMLKVRTMWGESEPEEKPLLVEDVSDRIPASKEAEDPRVTSRFAAFCRRFSLDELPQLYHVMRGEMSLVGPRPITLAELETYYGDCAGEVVSLRPGLTGLWQTAGRNQLSYEERRLLDLQLVHEVSPALYFRILLRSIPKVLAGSGAF